MATFTMRFGIVLAAVAAAAALLTEPTARADEPRVVAPQSTIRPAAPTVIDRSRATTLPPMFLDRRFAPITQQLEALIAIRSILPVVEAEPDCPPPVDVGHWCQELVTKTCGAENQCSNSTGCDPANHLLDLFCTAEGDDREEMLVTCLISLQDEIIFHPCDG